MGIIGLQARRATWIRLPIPLHPSPSLSSPLPFSFRSCPRHDRCTAITTPTPTSSRSRSGSGSGVSLIPSPALLLRVHRTSPRLTRFPPKCPDKASPRPSPRRPLKPTPAIASSAILLHLWEPSPRELQLSSTLPACPDLSGRSLALPELPCRRHRQTTLA